MKILDIKPWTMGMELLPAGSGDVSVSTGRSRHPFAENIGFYPLEFIS